MSATVANPLDLIAQMAAAPKAGKDKKPSKPEIDLSPELEAAAKEFITQKALEETAKARCAAAKDQLLAAAGPRRLAWCVAQKAVQASVAIVAGAVRLTMTQTKQYSKVPEARTADLKAAFGEQYERFFTATMAIGLKPESANNNDVLTALIEKLGPVFFAQHFAVTRDLEVAEAFHNAYTTDASVQAIAKPFIDDQTIKPYSPSFKVA